VDRPIDPNTASPSEYLRYLQVLAASQSSTLGSWSSLEVSEALGNQVTRQERLQQVFDYLVDSSGLQGTELEEFRTHISEIRAEIQDVQIPTGIGNPAFYMTLADVVRDVEQAVQRLGYQVPDEVAFGALPTGQVNGLACRVPAGGLIVALDDGVFMFLSLLAKAVATFYRVEITADGRQVMTLVDSDIPRAVETNEDGNRRWLEVLVATFAYTHPEFAPWRPPSPEHTQIAGHLLTGAEMFIVAHEFAHLILRHYDPDRPTSTRRLAADAEVENIQTWRDDEFEAHRLGLAILRDYHRQGDLSVESTRAAVCFLFGCLLAFETTAMLDGIVVEAETHPATTERLERLLRQLAEEEGIPPDTPTDAASIYQVMAQLWAHNVYRYLEWRESAINGTVPWDDSAPYSWPYGNDPR
jgi:hypothetical protein